MHKLKDFFKYLVHIKQEIMLVGFSDWFWYVFILNRDQFNKKLDLDNREMDRYENPKDYVSHILRLRSDARRIELKLLDLKTKKSN